MLLTEHKPFAITLLKITFHRSHSSRQLLHFTASIALLISFSAKSGAKDSSFPGLNLLPEGSIINDVKLPRYDIDFQPLSLLTADTITVKADSIIDADNAHVELYNPDGSIKMQTQMEHAIYHQQSSILSSPQKVVITGSRFQATAQGITLHEKTLQGFLKGPAITEFIIPSKETSTVMKPTTRSSSRAIASSLIAISSGLILADTSTEDEVQQSMHGFLSDINKEELLENPTHKYSETPDLEVEAQKLIIECDGGIYFDSQTGVYAYFKNIKLSSPEFNLTCSDHLKAYFDPENLPGKSNEKKTEPEENFEAREDLQKIQAQGNVIVTGKDDQGNDYVARAATASYDAQSETLVLRGGFPSLQRTKEFHIKASTQSAFITIPKNGKIKAEGGSWKTLIAIPEKK
ncbi:MAG: hypothetical protein ACSHX0_11260 [Akkermansiaceae bacterium]